MTRCSPTLLPNKPSSQSVQLSLATFTSRPRTDSSSRGERRRGQNQPVPQYIMGYMIRMYGVTVNTVMGYILRMYGVTVNTVMGYILRIYGVTVNTVMGYNLRMSGVTVNIVYARLRNLPEHVPICCLGHTSTSTLKPGASSCPLVLHRADTEFRASGPRRK